MCLLFLIKMHKAEHDQTKEAKWTPAFLLTSRSSALNKSGPYPFLMKSENAVKMPRVLLKALFSHLNATCWKPSINSTFLSWGSRTTAGLSLSFGILPAFAWVLGLLLNGRAFCKAFGMCSELKCFFCLTTGWKRKIKQRLWHIYIMIYVHLKLA